MDHIQYAHYFRALAAGTGVETERGNPRSGYYRYRNEAFAIWRDEAGELHCWRSGTMPAPHWPDEIDDLFGFLAPHPITRDAFDAFRLSGRWPEDVDKPYVPLAPEPHEALRLAVRELQDEADGWLEVIGEVATQEAADKAANYADKFSRLEGEAELQRTAEKRPHLDAGRAIDARWRPTIAAAETSKRWAKRVAEPFLIAERRRLRAEAARRESPPAEPPNAQAGTQGRVMAVRTRKEGVVVDAPALLRWLAEQNAWPLSIVEGLQKYANGRARADLETPGVEIREIEEVA